MTDDYSADQYQTDAMRSRHERSSDVDAMVFSAMEMASEMGEVANLIYKHVWQQHPLDKAAVIEELGDVLWGIASMCDALDVSLADVMRANTAKLKKRYPQGFTAQDSLARVDHDAPAFLQLNVPWENLMEPDR